MKHSCKHLNASLLVHAPVLFKRGSGHVTGLVVGETFREARPLLLTCPDCGETIHSVGMKYLDVSLKRLIDQANREKEDLPGTRAMRSASQEIREQLSRLEDPLPLETVDQFIAMLMSFQADGSVLIGRRASWNGQAVPIVRVVGRNIAAPGDVGLQVQLRCHECQQNQEPFLLISGLPPYWSASFSSLAEYGKYIRALDTCGFFALNLGRKSYVCEGCRKASHRVSKRSRD